MDEKWKDIEDYENIYQVSNKGRVRNKKTNRLLTPSGKPYLTIKLYKNGKHTAKRVHRLVACAFLENPQKLNVVNHKDENKLNNNADNLEWCTQKQNNRHSFKLHPERIKGMQTAEANKKRTIKKSRAVAKCDLVSGETIAIYASAREAARQTGFSQGNISNCCRGGYKHAYGYLWKYI